MIKITSSNYSRTIAIGKRWFRKRVWAIVDKQYCFSYDEVNRMILQYYDFKLNSGITWLNTQMYTTNSKRVGVYMNKKGIQIGCSVFNDDKIAEIHAAIL